MLSLTRPHAKVDRDSQPFSIQASAVLLITAFSLQLFHWVYVKLRNMLRKSALSCFAFSGADVMKNVK
jgi:hypothetical protein